MHRSRVALARANAKWPGLSKGNAQQPLTRLQLDADRTAALSAMRAEETYVARYRAMPRSSGMTLSLGRRTVTQPVRETTFSAKGASESVSRFSLSDPINSMTAGKQRVYSTSRASSSSSGVAQSGVPTDPPGKGPSSSAPGEEEDDESSWAFGGGRSSQGGPASDGRSKVTPKENKIEFIVHGSAGKGATPDYGRRKRYTHETDDRQATTSKDQQIAQSYRHEYAPTARSPRPLPHHTYFSTPSSSFNDDAAATAAGVGPVGVGGPRSGLGSGAGTHVLAGGHSIARKKSALILPGQGSQYVGMTDDIFRRYRAARQVWTTAEEALVLGAGSGRSAHNGLGPNDAVSAEQRQRFEEELEKSAAWDPQRHGPGAGTAVARSRRGWLRDLVFTGDQLNLTRAENAQPSILVSSLSILSVLRQEFAVDLIANHIDYVAGHGSGIYAALCVSGALDVRDAVRLLRHRGLTSSHYVEQSKVLFPEGSQKPESIYETWAFANAGSGKGAELLSRTGVAIEKGGVPPTSAASDADVVRNELDATPRRGWRRSQMSGCMIRPGKLQQALRMVEQVAAEIKAGKVDSVSPEEVVEVANINSSLQIVLSGTRVGVSMASDRLRQFNLGARAVNLPVSGPYHSSIMLDGAAFLKPAVQYMPLCDPDDQGQGRGYSGPLQLVSSREGAPILRSTDDIRADLSGALAKPVMWLHSIERMLEQGVQRFICLGPGRACAHLLSKELANRDRLAASEGKAPGNYEVWSINSVEDIEQIGAVLSQLSAAEGATRQPLKTDSFMAI